MEAASGFPPHSRTYVESTYLGVLPRIFVPESTSISLKCQFSIFLGPVAGHCRYCSFAQHLCRLLSNDWIWHSGTQ